MGKPVRCFLFLFINSNETPFDNGYTSSVKIKDFATFSSRGRLSRAMSLQTQGMEASAENPSLLPFKKIF